MVSKANTKHAIMLSMDNFGAWLVKELKDRKLSQSDLSRMSGLSRGTISNLISGARGRGTDSIEAIANALKLPPEQVFRIAGLLPTTETNDVWIEEMNHKMKLLPSSMRPIAEKLLNSLIEA